MAKFCAQLIVLALIQRDDLGGRTDLSFDVILLVHIISIGFIFKLVDYRSLTNQLTFCAFLLCAVVRIVVAVLADGLHSRVFELLAL